MSFIQLLGLVVLCLLFTFTIVDRVCKCVEKCAVTKSAATSVANIINKPKEG